MNMNQRDKLILIVVLVFVIWLVGVLRFIKPAINDVKNAQNTLSQKEVELAEKKQRIEDDKNLKEDIRVAYDKAVETGKIFYPRMIQYKAATEMQSQLDIDHNESNGQEIQNDSLSVSAMGSAQLSKYVYRATTVNTTLDNIVAQMDQAAPVAEEGKPSSNLTAYTFGFPFVATKKDVLQFAENMLNNEHKTLVIESMNVEDVGENEDDSEWHGSMSMTMYMIPQLKDPDIVNQQIENGENVTALDDVAE